MVLIQRLLLLPVLLLGIAAVSFGLSRATGVDPVIAIVGERAMEDPAVVAAARAQWGLDRPVVVQFLRHVANAAQGDFGTSFRTRRPVGTDLAERLPATLELVLAATLLGTLLGGALALLSARWPHGLLDQAVRGFASAGVSIPVFLAGLLFLWLFATWLDWLPGPGRLDARLTPPPVWTGLLLVDAAWAMDWAVWRDAARRLVLPAAALGWGIAALVARLLRATLIEELARFHIVAARSRGLSEGRLLLDHALPNAMVPALTLISLSFATLVAGAVLTETVFAWPGVGAYALESARTLDYPAIMAVTMLGGVALALSGVVADAGQAWLDPRLRDR
ncbi:ABC transporter permease [Roseococcus microcysteis]|uniref:ABC transporter permease n=1 Tax=Roseococcus microcysteis TaxID=2771361 RepID=UPI001CC5851C|nr:ABC transporter permease [Roseococcus microcysteis]